MEHKAPVLNVKNMIEKYLDYQVDAYLYDAFHYMALVGFITAKAWNSFNEKVGGWEMSDDLETVRDMNRGGAVVARRNQATRELELV